MWVQLTSNQFHPLKKDTKEMSASNKGRCIDPSKILEKRKNKNCTDDCIPTILSSIFNMSTFKECPDYHTHFCALEEIFVYAYDQTFQCTNSEVEKYFDGTLNDKKGISYANWVGKVTTSGNDDERNRTLLVMRWSFISTYVTDREEVLVYGAVDLVSWLGGAIGVFGGYSIYDLSSQIIDLIFSLISRFSNTNTNI